MGFAEKIVQLPPGDLGVAFGKTLQKACVLEVANSSEMKGKLQKGDIVIGFKDDGVEYRNLSLPLLVSKLNSTKHSHFRSITVVETDLMDERALVKAPRKAFIEDSANDISVQSSYGCVNALMELADVSVSLAMFSCGMPKGPAKVVARKLVKRAKKALKDEIRGIAKDYFESKFLFESPNPVSIAAGLVRIMSIILDDIGMNDIENAIKDAIGGPEVGEILFYFTLYFVSGGSALAAKLILFSLEVKAVVEAAKEVKECCGDLPSYNFPIWPIKNQIEDTKNHVKEKIEDTKNHVTEKIEDTKNHVKEKVEDVANSIIDKIPRPWWT